MRRIQNEAHDYASRVDEVARETHFHRVQYSIDSDSSTSLYPFRWLLDPSCIKVTTTRFRAQPSQNYLGPVTGTRPLFPQVATIVHHGGAGTIGAAIRAGKPQIICPFVGDQYFWGQRAADLGIAPSPIPQTILTAERLADAIKYAVTNTNVQQRALSIGETIRAENGIERAVKRILNNVH